MSSNIMQIQYDQHVHIVGIAHILCQQAEGGRDLRGFFLTGGGGLGSEEFWHHKFRSTLEIPTYIIYNYKTRITQKKVESTQCHPLLTKLYRNDRVNQALVALLNFKKLNRYDVITSLVFNVLVSKLVCKFIKVLTLDILPNILKRLIQLKIPSVNL